MSLPALGPHDVGRTAYYALAPDLPVSYCLFVPRTLDRERPVHLVVALHGANRAAETCRDAFACLAEDRNAIVLAPLFPRGPLGDSHQDLDEDGLRHDLMLLRMMDTVAARYQVAFSRVAVFGLETGARLAHRFMLRHPGRLNAAALCAPPAPGCAGAARRGGGPGGAAPGRRTSGGQPAGPGPPARRRPACASNTTRRGIRCTAKPLARLPVAPPGGRLGPGGAWQARRLPRHGP